MQIESLKVFCDLAETESFTKAAQINGVTQSAVSQNISSLEHQFNSLLIERSKKNFRLTPEGEVVYDYSKRMLQSYDAIQSKVQDIKGVITGEIRLATVYSVGLHQLPPYIKQFLKEHPNVNIHVEYRRANQVYDDVLGNVVDLGLVAYPNRDHRLELIPIRKDRLVLICHPQHSFAGMKSIRLKALNGQKFVSFEKDIPTQKALDRIFKDHGVTVLSVMQFDNVETVKRAVEIDSGIAIVPEETIRQEISNQTIVSVALESEDCVRQLGLIHKKDKVLSPAMKKFIALLKQPL
jgi:LysR family transcriptional regulator, transcriptional activator of the cysJI operon